MARKCREGAKERTGDDDKHFFEHFLSMGPILIFFYKRFLRSHEKLVWGSEIQMRLGFRKVEKGLFANVLDFIWDLKSGFPSHLKYGQMAAILSKPS